MSRLKMAAEQWVRTVQLGCMRPRPQGQSFRDYMRYRELNWKLDDKLAGKWRSIR